MIAKLENFTSVTTKSPRPRRAALNGDIRHHSCPKYVMESARPKRPRKSAAGSKHQLKSNQRADSDFIKRQTPAMSQSAGSSQVEHDAIIVIDRDSGGGRQKCG